MGENRPGTSSQRIEGFGTPRESWSTRTGMSGICPAHHGMASIRSRCWTARGGPSGELSQGGYSLTHGEDYIASRRRRAEAAMTEPSTDLYAVLGLSRDADQAAIRRAYRNKARHAHPDGGGSPESFARVKTAYDTLINDARRQHYDETGEFDDAPINNAQVAEMLFAGLDLAMLN